MRALIAVACGTILACATQSRGPQTSAPQSAAIDDEQRRLQAGGAVRIDDELIARQVAPGAVVITHEPAYQSNILVVRTADGTLIVCSSPFDTVATRTMLTWLRRLFSSRRIIAFNTHFHLDGTAGNEAYAAECGVDMYATERTQKLLSAWGSADARPGSS